MWGFLTCLNDILVPHLKSIFDLTYARVMLVQSAFFSAYFLFSLPWSRFVNRIGYQRTMVVGLLTMACGAFLFLPAYILYISRFQIAPEERVLTSLFGQEYVTYRARVRRWI